MGPSKTDGTGGSYDHSAEYDPYQSAARQMQELLFGSGGGGASGGGQSAGGNQQSAGGNDNHLRPSTNSAFEKYVPSTADINTKMNSKTSFSSDTSPFITPPRRLDSLKGTPQSANWESMGGTPPPPSVTSAQQKTSQVNFNPLVSSSLVGKSSGLGNNNGSMSSTGGGGTSLARAKSPKVARFCHECGNPFALPNIRFCCECGVKRLYCWFVCGIKNEFQL